jgi:hypothetical protein
MLQIWVPQVMFDRTICPSEETDAMYFMPGPEVSGSGGPEISQPFL